MRSDDEAVDTLRRAHREASRQLDDAPAARVRAAVLAAAARGVEAPPLRGVPTATSAPFRSRRWPLSAAALLVVSVMTGLVVTHGMRDSPERITTVAAGRSDLSAPKREAVSTPDPESTTQAPASAPSNDRTPAVDAQRAAARRPAPVRREAGPAGSRASATASGPASTSQVEPESRSRAAAPPPSELAVVEPPLAASPSPPSTERASKAERAIADSATANDTRDSAEAARVYAPVPVTAMRARPNRRVPRPGSNGS